MLLLLCLSVCLLCVVIVCCFLFERVFLLILCVACLSDVVRLFGGCYVFGVL